jgi:uncharacterized protein YbgA (DUF1722 family)/uncharacterized protein YbbK (DUF523 family)
MTKFARPRVVVSKCLGFEDCRYDGSMVEDKFLKKLGAFVEYVTVCPEAEIGLGTPRPPIRIVAQKEKLQLVQPATGRDVSEEMRAFTDTFLAAQTAVDGFVLKSRSPSCGFTDVKIYPSSERGPALGRARGFFGGAVVDHFPQTAIEDEGRLKNFTIREHFLTRLFALAAFRGFRAQATMAGLVQFHTEHKLLLMAASQKEMRECGRVVANATGQSLPELIAAYALHFQHAFVRQPRHTSHVNVLEHALGYFSEQLLAREKHHFLQILRRYAAGKVPLSSALSILKSWLVRFETAYLAGQTYFQPFPEDLVEVSDSGKGRED